jgi:hypothetical protein
MGRMIVRCYIFVLFVSFVACMLVQARRSVYSDSPCTEDFVTTPHSPPGSFEITRRFCLSAATFSVVGQTLFYLLVANTITTPNYPHEPYKILGNGVILRPSQFALFRSIRAVPFRSRPGRERGFLRLRCGDEILGCARRSRCFASQHQQIQNQQLQRNNTLTHYQTLLIPSFLPSLSWWCIVWLSSSLQVSLSAAITSA